MIRLKEIPVVSQTIILSDTIEERYSGFAKIVAVGTKVIDDLNVGDTVLLPPYKGAPWGDDGVEYFIVEANDVMGVSR